MSEEYKIKTLIVDDDRTAKLFLTSCIEKLGHEVLEAEDGKQAIDVLRQHKDIDLVLLDKEMPYVSGISVVEFMSQDVSLSKVPVIMVTGYNSDSDIKEGIDAGVFYYLAKPINNDILQSIVKSAEHDIRRRKTLTSELKKHKGSFGLITHCEFEFKTLEEAENLAVFLSNCYPDPHKVVLGIWELLMNAVEHGNLSISYEEKTELLEQNKWHEEVLRRQDLPEFSLKKVRVSFKRLENDELTLKIKDEGKGFNWRKFIDIDPSRAAHNHGRAIAQAKTESFDDLIYNDIGNEVTAISRGGEEIDW